MKQYHHIKEEDRLRIYELLLEGQSIQTIARQMGFHKSTLYRELNRNSSKLGYRPDFASQPQFGIRYGYCNRKRDILEKF